MAFEPFLTIAASHTHGINEGVFIVQGGPVADAHALDFVSRDSEPLVDNMLFGPVLTVAQI